MVQQNESFSHIRTYESYVMDYWANMDNGNLSKTKPRLASDEDLATLNLLYDACKVAQDYSI